jgi:hypothetical protein
MEKDLKIKTVGVQLNVITVDGKKMTKSVFSQIIKASCFDKEGFFKGDEVLGFVKQDTRWLIWVKDGLLRKTELKHFSFHEHLRGYQLEQILSVYHYLTGIKIEEEFNVESDYDEEHPSYNTNLLPTFQNNYRAFLKSLEQLQIFIAI